MATAEQMQLFASDVLKKLGELSIEENPKEVIGFLASEGAKYSRQLMVIGRAPNGWDVGEIRTPELIDSSVATDYAKEVFASVSGSSHCPLSWVIGCWGNTGGPYNTKKSAFWRVIKRTIEELGVASKDSDDWSSYIVWSNLYKVAPADGGNPSSTLAWQQQDGCINLLKLELQQYQPKYLLLLTGYEWAEPFIEEVCNEQNYYECSGLVEGGGTTLPQYGNSFLVIAKHPQGKPEDKWVYDVIDEFRKLGANNSQERTE